MSQIMPPLESCVYFGIKVMRVQCVPFSATVTSAHLLYHNDADHVMLVWITVCLKTGETWEKGFCRALCRSALVVPVISRETFPSQMAAEICEDSPCDNVILELDLALALV